MTLTGRGPVGSRLQVRSFARAFALGAELDGQQATGVAGGARLPQRPIHPLLSYAISFDPAGLLANHIPWKSCILLDFVSEILANYIEETMVLREHLHQLMSHPRMFLPAEEYDVVVAYLLGFDAASGGGALTGFREWLITQLEGGYNLTWFGIVPYLMDQRTSPRRETHVPEEKERVEFLFETLEAFLKERDAPGGLRAIYVRHDAWLRSQSWYTTSASDWFPSPISKKPPRNRTKKDPATRRRR